MSSQLTATQVMPYPFPFIFCDAPQFQDVYWLFLYLDLLKALEDNNDGHEVCAASLLGVTSYGVSMTTLEEVFLQLEDTSEGSADEPVEAQVGDFPRSRT